VAEKGSLGQHLMARLFVMQWNLMLLLKVDQKAGGYSTAMRLELLQRKFSHLFAVQYMSTNFAINDIIIRHEQLSNNCHKK